MPYPFPLNLELFLAKEEVTYGVDPTPAAATDAIRHIKHLWTDTNSEYAWPNLREDVVTNTLVEAAPAVPRGRMVSFEVELELKGSGVAYATGSVVPEVDETVTYALADTDHSSATCYIYSGGKLFVVVGCRGNMVWSAPAGTLGRMRFALQGILSSVTQSDPAPSGTFDSTESPAAVNMGLSIDPGTPWTPNFTEAEIDLGNNVVRLDDGNASDGIEGFFIPSRETRFRLTARNELITTYDPEALRLANTVHTIDMEMGQTQYNSIDVDVDDSSLIATPNRVEDNEFTGWELEYMLRDLAIIFD